MSCRRAFETDLLAVLHGEGTDAKFVAHHPACQECSAEVAVWRELDALLRAGAPTAESHPAPAALLAFVDAPATLAAAARGDVEGHLASCRACAEEVRTLRAFDATALAAVSAGPRASSAARVEPRPSTLRPSAAEPGRSETSPPPRAAEGSWLGRVVWHPAFAYALVVLLLVPVLRDQLPRVAEETRVVDARRGAATSTAPDERDGGRAAAMMKRSAPGTLADAPRPAQNAGAPAEPRRPLAQAPAVPPARPAAAPRAEEEGAPSLQDLAGELRPEAKAHSADAASARLDLPLAVGSDSAERGAAADHLGERARHEAAPGLGGTAGDQKPLVIALASNMPTTIAAGAGDAGAVVRVVPPAELAPGPLDVTVRARAGQRELHTRVTDRANAIELRIPPHWLAPGDYAVTLAPVDAGPGRAHEPAIFGFTVRAPTAR